MIKLNLQSNKSKLIALGLLVLVVASGFFAYDYYTKQKELSEYQGDINIKTLKEKNDLMKTLAKLAILPQNEEPTIATVTDAFRLRGQKFFAQAENGDKVIIYSDAQRALLYRPSAKRIVESAPVNLTGFSDNSETQQASENFVLGDTEDRSEPETQNVKEPEEVEQVEPAKLAIYNGTLYISGLAGEVATYLENELGSEMLSIEIVANAEDTYEETIIIDVTGEKTETLEQIANLLQAQVIEKPEDVNFPEVDIVVIAGKNIDLDKIQ